MTWGVVFMTLGSRADELQMCWLCLSRTIEV